MKRRWVLPIIVIAALIAVGTWSWNRPQQSDADAAPKAADIVEASSKLAVAKDAGKGVIVECYKQGSKLRVRVVSRDDFVAQYPTGQTPAQYVSALNTNAGLVITPAEEADLAARLASGQETRATVLRKIADDDELRSAETNRAFVLMQYFGYLRREPDEAPDTNLDGYNFWLKKLEDFGGDFKRAEMVKAFLASDEYRKRFGR